jgi:prepilin-type N-terminal cleavage/methylation domain-containing protein
MEHNDTMILQQKSKTLRSAGFTIVELLIVIVVIAILAAITIVAYNGIQNRANDASVSSDLRTLMQKIEAYKVDTTEYPTDAATLQSLGLSVNKSSVSTSINNTMLYCRSDASAGFVVMGKSGNPQFIRTNVSPSPYPVSWTSSRDTLCPGMGIPLASAGFSSVWLRANNAWVTWL